MARGGRTLACRDVFLRKLIVHELNEDTSFTNCAITVEVGLESA